MDFFNEIVNNIWVQRCFWSIVVIIASVIIYTIISKALDKHEKHKSKLLVNKKGRTMNRMIKSIIRYVIIIVDFLIILQIFGIDVSSMLAAAGVAGIIIAFAVKDALQDIIRGFDIISDNYYNVGDVVKIDTIEGKVLAVGLKTTKIQDINTLNTVSIANRNILQVEVMSDMIDIDVPLSYELSLDQAEQILTEATDEIKKQDNVTNSEYRKVSNFSDSSMSYRIKVFGDPACRPQIRRDSLDTIAKVLARYKISVPYPQLDLHTKKS
ncbi:MAG: mechanosensitive ion channel family protein [Candidatus Saccharibacteria bacterium]|nr:mechanosensitive ion channel family protein [Candidatus Saccharibacteria bacterium]